MRFIDNRDDGGAFIVAGDLPSWWRSNVDRRFWSVHSNFWGHSRAVQDDFGNLVRVPS